MHPGSSNLARDRKSFAASSHDALETLPLGVMTNDAAFFERADPATGGKSHAWTARAVRTSPVAAHVIGELRPPEQHLDSNGDNVTAALFRQWRRELRPT
jgi:hypothetical protein